jgi:hypothetical protein
MIDAFSTALGTALTGFVTDISSGIGDNIASVLPITLGVAGIFLLWRVVSSFLHGR